jgi:uracil-DNA glycosylase
VLNRQQAVAKADAHLQSEGLSEVALTAVPNPTQELWLVGHHDPAHPDDLTIGQGPLVVPTEGDPYWASGSIPPWPEEIGLEEPESWRYERGDDLLPADWAQQLQHQQAADYWPELLDFVAHERLRHDVFPPPSQTFAALELTRFEDVRVVILGQDPYPTPGEAHGLAFSVPYGVEIPRSLGNIHAELASDFQVEPPAHGNLEHWAMDGVLLLNTALTVRAGTRADQATHRRWRWKRQGWTTFTDAVIRAIAAKPARVVFILWGRDAQRKQRLVDANSPHEILTAPHPSPLSARLGFHGSRPFSAANHLLSEAGRKTVEWG